ncbi:hypothetical protein MC885_020783 [Smutsia gigantea]|nr:hypothetical protein MC885_020783 [Smutsia gigantea]
MLSPVFWETNDNPLTWHSQLALRPGHKHCPGRLQRWPATAGVPASHLQVLQEAGPQQVAGEAQKGKAGSILKELKLTVLVGTVLGLLGVLLEPLHPSQGRTSDQVLLVE